MTTSSRSPWSLLARSAPTSFGPVPDTVPVLSRGRHRSPRKGACFMEMASWLAGERWSDHPSCTHGLLATTARSVNDHVTDEARARIVPLIPDVIGLLPTDPRLEAEIALDAAMLALPVVAAPRQRVAAVGLIRCQQVLNRHDGRPLDHVDEQVADALDGAPTARDWARRFSVIGESGRDSFARRGAPAIVHSSVVAIAESCAKDPDTMLVGLLERTIDRCRARMPREQVDAQAARAASSASASTAGRERLRVR